jgi:hypothetical protein
MITTPTPRVLAARQGFEDAQSALLGASQRLGHFTITWYGKDVSDETGSFALVSSKGPLSAYVGDVLSVTRRHTTVFVYVLGSARGLAGTLALARQPYLYLSLLCFDPVTADVGVVSYG